MLCRFVPEHLFEPQVLVEVGGLPDVAEGKRQARGNAGEGDLVLGIGRGNSAHFQDATAYRVEGVRGLEQRASLVKLQLQTAISALFQNPFDPAKAVCVGAAGTGPVGLHLPGEAVLSSGGRCGQRCGNTKGKG